MKVLRLTLNFYSSFAFASWMITILCVIISYTQGINIFTALFWFKIITLGIIVYFINNYKRNEFYYYKNLGLSKKVLWISSLTFDFILFLTLIIITLLVR